MAWFVEIFLRLFFSSIVYPIALEICKRRETDPVFKAASDEVYTALQGAQTTEDRKAAARKLYELQNGS